MSGQRKRLVSPTSSYRAHSPEKARARPLTITAPFKTLRQRRREAALNSFTARLLADFGVPMDEILHLVDGNFSKHRLAVGLRKSPKIEEWSKEPCRKAA